MEHQNTFVDSCNTPQTTTTDAQQIRGGDLLACNQHVKSIVHLGDGRELCHALHDLGLSHLLVWMIILLLGPNHRQKHA